MTDYENLLNQEVTNKNGERGVVVFSSDDRLVVKYPGGEKAYRPDIAFKSGFLCIENDGLTKEIEADLRQKAAEEDKKSEELEAIRRKYFARKKKVNETYRRLMGKSVILQLIFGSDFIYPPLVAFKRKYASMIEDTPSVRPYRSYAGMGSECAPKSTEIY